MSKSNQTAEPSVLLDSDVFRHFLNSGQLDKLAKVFAGRLVILDKVKNELTRSKSLVTPVADFIQQHSIPVIPFPSGDRAVLTEYAYLCREFGEGESACMAVAKHHKQFIASSNLRDIKEFCENNQIRYYTTLDILWEAREQQLLDDAGCETCITDILAKGGRIPVKDLDGLKAIKQPKPAPDAGTAT